MWRARSLLFPKPDAGGPRSKWLQTVGNAGGLPSFAAAVLLLCQTSTPAARFDVAWLFIALWAVGIGLALGGVRFGRGAGRQAAWLSLATLLVLLLALAVVRASQWEEIYLFWQRRLE
jgi:hypothetical protein